MYLFDASSIINLVKRAYLKPFARGVTLDLAIYESINAVWKECFLLHRLDEETARKLLSILKEVFDIIAIASIRGSEVEIFGFAVKEGLTVYDAAYLYYAVKNKLTLITDDRKLLVKAKQYVESMSTSELASR
jgi:predicted nucleic acid-binding protein